MKKINYTLPEFCLLDAISHMGDELKDRTVMVHLRSFTIMEVVFLDEIEDYNFDCKTYKFNYVDKYGVEEHYMLALHFSLAGEEDYILNDIFEKSAKWYVEVIKWEDKGIENEDRANLN
jgi:hypothetical protein